MWICPYYQNIWQKLHPKFKQMEVWDCPLLWQLLSNMLFAGTYGYWQQMNCILQRLAIAKAMLKSIRPANSKTSLKIPFFLKMGKGP